MGGSRSASHLSGLSRPIPRRGILAPVSTTETGYLGVDQDQMPESIREAKIRYGNTPGATLVQSDFSRTALPESDFVVASCALGYCCSNSSFYFEMIARMYCAARGAVAFKMLDAAHFPGHDLPVGHEAKNRSAEMIEKP
jgi:hypothetical protein